MESGLGLGLGLGLRLGLGLVVRVGVVVGPAFGKMYCHVIKLGPAN